MMKAMTKIKADFTFHDGLDWFLCTRKTGNTVTQAFEDHQSVKHLIEAAGVPHVEVGRILVNATEADISYRPGNGDRIDVFPPAPSSPAEARFMLDNHLGRLASQLRMLGFDCLYHNDFEDSEMAHLLEEDERILLTRDHQLLMRKAVKYGYCPRSLEPPEQLIEVVRRFDLAPRVKPFTRCLKCNGLLEPVDKQEIIHLLEPKTKLYYNVFSRCPVCGQIYWQGSHWIHMQELIGKLKQG